MTIERLEEISAWAERQARICAADGAKQADDDFADLARCARAWATLQHLGNQEYAELWDCSCNRYGVYLDNATPVGHSTAIEAIEAAGGAND